MKDKFYSLKNILSKNAHYNLIIGERSNGKSYAVKQYCIEKFFEDNSQTAMLRRWGDDLKTDKCDVMFDDLIPFLEKKSKGKYNCFKFKRGKWYFAHIDEEGEITINDRPFAFAFPISAFEHYKSSSYPDIKTVFFDEFLTRGYYLNDEFIAFMNVLSTIIRLKNDVKIFMCGNTVNQYSPYFDEMGLIHIKQQQKGTIDVYEYGEKSPLKVAVEFSDFPGKNKESNFYFAFDNPKLNMITGNGDCVWEMDIYPHLLKKYNPTDILYTYFIKFGDDFLQCEIIQRDESIFTYIHRKSTELKNPNNDLIFSLDYDERYNWVRRINNPVNKRLKKIWYFFITDKVFYQDNYVGEIVRNYIACCHK